MRILVDGMGGDNAPVEIVKGCIAAAGQTEHEILLVGKEDLLWAAIREQVRDKGPSNLGVVHASEVIETEEAPVRAIRSKKDSSMVVGLQMVKDGEADLFFSAGNSGALMAGGLFILGRIRGIDRPAIAAAVPALNAPGSFTLMVDSGANSDCKPNNLLEFAWMGSIYSEKVYGIERPRVGLLNMGVEAGKGPLSIKAAYDMLGKAKSIRFIGNVEAREVPLGACDVLACDGFAGNVLLKTMEGTGKGIMHLVKEKILGGGLLAKLGAAMLSAQLKDLRSVADYSEYGGAPILGVRGAVIKMHGSADAKAVCNSILKGIPYAENGVVQGIEEAVLELEAIEQDEQPE